MHHNPLIFHLCRLHQSLWLQTDLRFHYFWCFIGIIDRIYIWIRIRCLRCCFRQITIFDCDELLISTLPLIKSKTTFSTSQFKISCSRLIVVLPGLASFEISNVSVARTPLTLKFSLDKSFTQHNPYGLV